MINNIIIKHKYKYEAERLIRSFFMPHKFVLLMSENNDFPDKSIISYDDSVLIIDGDIKIVVTEKLTYGLSEGQEERHICTLIYRALSRYTGRELSWGILTGIRPVKFIAKKREEYVNIRDRFFTENYLIRDDKLQLANEIIDARKPYISGLTDDMFCLYVGIPFCPSRCSYCSFVSHDIENKGELAEKYTELLLVEIAEIRELAAKAKRKLAAIYIGGGTPTSLPNKLLEKILSEINKFDLSELREYTVEAGRPDTITEENLAIIKSFKADRISINPQTMNDSVLHEIGRNHSVRDVINAFALARKMGFKNINMDIIAGLPSDDEHGFKNTLSEILKLSPEAITVHTLSMKRASRLFYDENNNINFDENPVEKMINHAYHELHDNFYIPYYLYRQNNTLSGQENVGYSKKGYGSLYNIAIMDEIMDIFAAGCGASTKLIKNNDIVRIYNHKYPHEYIERFDEILKKKKIMKNGVQKWQN